MKDRFCQIEKSINLYVSVSLLKKWWQDPDLNWGHKAFQASALPTELSRHNTEDTTKIRY